MQKALILILIIHLISACCKNPDNLGSTSAECLNEAKDTSHLGLFQGQFPSFYCDVQHKANLLLEESSKDFLPQFCQELGEVLTYKNINGQSIVFTIKAKSFLNNFAITSRDKCYDDSTKSIGYSFFEEKGFITFESDVPKIKLYLELNAFPENGWNYDGKFGDMLSILRLDTTTSGSYYNDFTAIVNKRTLSYETNTRQEFYDSIVLKGKNYENVLSCIPHPIGNYLKFYYTKEIGLIGFEDKDGIVWTLEE
jgi:hypothetical protein